MLGREEFFNVTKLLHNALQGNPHGLTDEDWEIFDRYNELNAARARGRLRLRDRPRPPAGGAAQVRRPTAPGRWIWRCHIDLSTPNADVARRTCVPMVEPYDCKVFHLQQYVPAGVDGKVEIVPPAIDPLSPKNMALSPEDAAFVCDQFGVDVDRPLICQVSRFDPWKDPLGVIDAYRIVKEEVEGVQLALVGSMATDDPEGWDFFQKTHEHAAGDEDIKILNNLNNVGAIEVNAFQSQADVRAAEVDPRGLRPDRLGGALEGAPDDRRQRRRHPAPDPGRRDRLPRELARGGRRGAASRSSATPSSASGSAGPARSTCARTS